MSSVKEIVLQDLRRLAKGKRDGYLDDGGYFRFDTKKGDIIIANPQHIGGSISIKTDTPESSLFWAALGVVLGSMVPAQNEARPRVDDDAPPLNSVQRKKKK